VYAAFTKRIEAEGVARKQQEGEKIDRVLAMWKGRVEWWEKAYTYPKNFVYHERENEKMGLTMGGRAGAAATSPQAAEVMRDQIANMRPAAPDASAGSGVGGGRPAQLGGLRRDSTEVAAAPAASGNSLFSTGGEMQGQSGGGPVAAIVIKGWDPETPYLKAMKGAKDAYGAYLQQREKNFDTPAFYLDCGSFLIANGRRAEGVRVLTNIAQLRLGDAALLRVAAYRLMQVGEYDVAVDLFEKVKALRPDEPQSFRDLGQALAGRGLQRREAGLKNNDGGMVVAAYDDLNRAMELYRDVVMKEWDRFPEIEVTALMEVNGFWARAKGMETQAAGRTLAIRNPLDERLVKNLDCDVRIVMTWDADDTDIDLHVKEPSGEEAFYGHNLTTIGGMVSKDFTQGYGPEEYCLRKAMPGVYTIEANYYGSRAQKVMGPVTVQATVITHFGRPDEKRESLTLRLAEQKETVEIGKVTIK
jgi:hypothetical protein